MEVEISEGKIFVHLSNKIQGKKSYKISMPLVSLTWT